jgi:hypothetical protein
MPCCAPIWARPISKKRAPLDTQQFAIAKQLDPMTRRALQRYCPATENRPVEAVGELEKSAELNDNRAAYRGSLLLDKDRAARASIARACGSRARSARRNESTVIDARSGQPRRTVTCQIPTGACAGTGFPA